MAERTLGLAPVARPLTPPVFAPAPAVAIDAFTPAEPTATRPRQERPKAVELRRAVPERSEPAFARPDLPLEKTLAEITGEKAADTRQLRRGVQETTGPVLGLEPDVQPLDTDRPNNRAAKARAMEQEIEPAVASQTETAAAHPASRLSVQTSLSAADTGVRATSPGDTPPPHPPVADEQPAPPAFQPPPLVPPRPVRIRERGTDGNHELAESVVEVSIGRIEVRAVFPEPQLVAPARRAADSALSLADYLKERDRGLR